MIYSKKNFNIIEYLIEEKDINSKKIAEDLSVSKAYISNILNGKPIGLKFAEKIAKCYNMPLSEVLGEFESKNETNAELVSDSPQTTELPLITVASRASFNYHVFHDNSMVRETAPIYRVAVKGLRKPVLIDIDGDSMTPQLAPGTRVLADEVDPNDWNYITGVVAVSFKNQFVVKRIKENHSIETKSITLYSDNEIGGSFPVRLADINAIWKVLEIVKAKVE